jgi:hypothetical protein
VLRKKMRDGNRFESAPRSEPANRGGTEIMLEVGIAEVVEMNAVDRVLRE